MQDVAGCLGEDDVLAGLRAVLHPDAREQVGHLVVLRLRPLLERMVVAARAGDALAEKRLRGVLADLDGVLVQHEIVQRAVLARAARGQEDLAGELVPRLVVLHRIADPVVERPHGRRVQLAARDQQQVGPLVGPVIHELARATSGGPPLWPAYRPKCRPENSPLPPRSEARPRHPGRRAAGRSHRRRAWKAPGAGSSIWPTTRSSMKLLPGKLVVDRRADLVGKRHAQPRIEHPRRVPERDGRFARADHLHVAEIVHRGDAFVAGAEFHPARDVFRMAVGVARADHDLLFRTGSQHGGRREHFEAADLRIVRRGRRRRRPRSTARSRGIPANLSRTVCRRRAES